jgi:integrase
VTEQCIVVIIRRMRRKLAPKTIEHLKAPGPRRLEVWDTVLQGFGVRVSTTGRKVWFVVTRVGDRQKRVTIGTYPAVSLAEARDEARKLIRNAQLGVAEDSPASPTLTLGEATPLFINLYAKPKNRSWRACERLLGTFRALADKPLGELKRSDLVRVLDQLIASGTPYRANRALSALKKLMAWALDRGMIEVNPIAGLKAPATEQSRDRILTERELRDLLLAADQEGYPFGCLIKVLALTGQRRSEVSDMRWSEVDLETQLWTIPASRTKNKQSHTVPLAGPVLEILRTLPRFLGSDYVFTTTGTTPISGFGRAKGRLFAKVDAPDWRIHDLRRTAASGMARLGVAPHVVEKVLNHKSGIISGVAAVYNRYGYDLEKRDALEKWSETVLMLPDTPSEIICQAQSCERVGSTSGKRPILSANIFSASNGR